MNRLVGGDVAGPVRSVRTRSAPERAACVVGQVPSWYHTAVP